MGGRYSRDLMAKRALMRTRRIKGMCSTKACARGFSWGVLALITALVWVAAPALSLRPYIPGAVDFERGIPTAKRMAPPAVGAARSAHPRGGAALDLAADRGAAPLRPGRGRREMRARPDPGPRRRRRRWSNWVEQDDGDPDLRRRRRPGPGRAPRSARGAAPLRERLRDGGSFADRLLNSARAARSTPPSSRSPRPRWRRRSPPKPQHRQPRGLGRRPPQRRLPAREGRPSTGTVQAAVIHHTVNANDYTPEEAPGIVLGICRFHVNGNGWNDIGYNALVDRFGDVYEGRAGGLKRPVVGAQAQGFNAQTTAIASIGDHTSEAPDAAGAATRSSSSSPGRWRSHHATPDDRHCAAHLRGRPGEPVSRPGR